MKPIPAIERFWNKVDKNSPNGCWGWTAGKGSGGYGKFYPSTRKQVLAHRFSYELLLRPIPKGLEIDHLCRNRGCVNPSHLEAVTLRTNNLRGIGCTAQAIRKTHCPQGHPYDLFNTYWSRRGWRYCRTCNRLRARAYRASKH